MAYHGENQLALEKQLKPAINSGSADAVKSLIERGLNLNMPFENEHTPLLVALKYLKGHKLMEIVTSLVENGACVNKSYGPVSPLIWVVVRELDVGTYLLSKGADVSEVGDSKGNTPLMVAVEESNRDRGRIHLVERLISAGADINKANSTCSTALHAAILSRNNEAIHMLMKAGPHLEARDLRGRTPLLTAAYEGNENAIDVLKTYGADMRAVDNYGNSALMSFLQGHHEEEETLRILEFDNVEINKQLKNGTTPLMEAARRGLKSAVRILLELGADPNNVAQATKQETALSIVLDREPSSGSGLDCARQLIENNGLSNLPERCWKFFFQMILLENRERVQLMVTNGMAPVRVYRRMITEFLPYTATGKLVRSGIKLSPLATAVLCNNLAITRYLVENWFLTPADLVGSLELRNLRNVLDETYQMDCLRFLDENLSQPMSLLKLSFVAVSAQLGGVAGREERECAKFLCLTFLKISCSSDVATFYGIIFVIIMSCNIDENSSEDQYESSSFNLEKVTPDFLLYAYHWMHGLILKF
ncbi:ankyrin repeat protein [Plakobranchus ocellatus]|uniref:Ankyrin repeat protein n=1 Tax=Plakobranchus ocellatus TaxID=259542 RepID=A0AAV4DH20_9GAST|nr:ankyrin repeat protein [Plakobranchus ocellatus]